MSAAIAITAAVGSLIAFAMAAAPAIRERIRRNRNR